MAAVLMVVKVSTKTAEYPCGWSAAGSTGADGSDSGSSSPWASWAASSLVIKP